MPLRVERSSADIRMEPSASSYSRAAPNPSILASQYTWNGREPLVTASQSGKTRIGGVASSASISRTNFSIADAKANLTSFRRSELIGWSPLDKSGNKIAVIVDTAYQCADLLHIRGHRHVDQYGHFFYVGAYTRRGNGVAQELRICGTQSSPRGGKL